MASGQLSRAEALACSGCRHACHVMLYSDTKTQLFGRIPIRYIILVSYACAYVFVGVVYRYKWLSSFMPKKKRKKYTSASMCVHVWFVLVCGCISVWVYNKLCHVPQMQMRFDGLLGFPGGWVFPGAAFVLCFYAHRYVLLRCVSLPFSSQMSPIKKYKPLRRKQTLTQWHQNTYIRRRGR